MNHSPMQQPSFQQAQSFDLGKWLFKIKKLTPWLIATLIVFLAGAWLYLRFTEPIYRSTASLLIRNSDKEEDPALKDLNIVNPGKVVDNEVKVLRSPDLVKEVVINEQLFTDIKTKGNPFAGEREIYKDNLPLRIYVENPGSIARPVRFELSRSGKDWSLSTTGNTTPLAIRNGHRYQIGTLFLRFTDNPKFAGSTETLESAYKVQLNPIEQVITQYVNALSVSASGKTSAVIELSLVDKNPTTATATLAALLDIYNRKSLEEKNTATANTLKFIDERLNLIRRDLNRVEGSVQAYKSSQIGNAEGQAGIYVNAYGELDKRMTDLQTQMNIVNSLEREIAGRPSGSSAIISTMGVEDATLGGLVQRYNDLLLNRERLQQFAAEKNPGLVDVQNQLADVRSSIGSNIRNIKAAYNVAMQDMNQKSALLGKQIRNAPQVEKDLGQITRDHTVQEQIYAFLLQKREERAMTLAANIPDARTIVEPTSLGKIAPAEATIWGGAALLGLLLPISILLLREFLDDKVGSRKEVEQKTILPVIGEIAFGKNSKTPLAVSANAHTLVSEQFRTMRTEINYRGKGAFKTILVTSQDIGEGKSFTSLNLAATYALLNKKVVLLEFDLRRPGLSDSLGFRNKPGITNYLGGTEELKNLLIEIPETNGNLFLLSAGPVAGNPSELISGSQMQKLINELQQSFDYIFIDTPPIGLVTDARLLQSYADLSIFVLRQGYSKKEVYPLLNQLQVQFPDQVQYLVLNGVGKQEQKYGTYAYRNNAYYEQDSKLKKKKGKRSSLEIN